MRKTSIIFSLLFIISTFFTSCNSSKNATKNYNTLIIHPRENDPPALIPKKDPAIVALKEKYAKMLHTTPDNIHNVKLYQFIDEWYGTPYLWGGTTKSGIDCSAFVQKLFAAVYNITIPRTSIEQFFTNDVEPFANTKYLSEGDMVFFRTIKGTIVSHVGFYLCNNKFVNASSSGRGVSIGDLSSDYWKERFVAAGRIKNPKKFITEPSR